MLRSFFGWVFYILVGVMLIAAFVSILLWLAAEGYFGEGAGPWLNKLAEALAEEYRIHGPSLEKLPGLFATAAALISGTLAIYKAYYFGDRKLPLRLLEFMNKNDHRLQTALPLQLAMIERAHAASKLGEPVAYTTPLDSFFRKLGFENHRTAISDIISRADEIPQQLKAVEAKAASLRLEKVTAHILRGAEEAAKAGYLDKANTTERRARNVAALHEFETALEYDRSNLDALELSARQMVLLGDFRAAEKFKQLLLAAQAQVNRLREARAFRLLSEYAMSGGVPGYRVIALTNLATSIDMLKQLDTHESENALELGKAYHTRGKLHARSQHRRLARRDLDLARGCYELLNGGQASKAMSDIGDDISRL